MAKNNSVIIKRVKKVEGGHHGGAWKVAYADFVTAMMAFFLLLWLLNATTDAQKRGIADYFSPTLATRSLTSGAGGVLGGKSVTEPGSMNSSSPTPAVTTEANKPPDFESDDNADSPGKTQNINPDDNPANASGAANAQTPTPNPTELVNSLKENKVTAAEAAALVKAIAENKLDTTQLTPEQRAALEKIVQAAKQDPSKAVDPSKLTDAQLDAIKAAKEEQNFEKTEKELDQAIQQVPDLKPLAKNLVVERTEEGLNIQILDQEKTAMFPSGAVDPNDSGKKLMALVAKAVAQLPNRLKITGHTDSIQFKNTTYDNWDLSADRAKASRHALIAAGLAPDRIASLSGVGDREPFVKDDPNSPRNRRISMVILRDPKPPTPAADSAPAPSPAPDAAAPAAGAAPAPPPAPTAPPAH